MEFNFVTIIALGLALLIGGFIGVGLGRRSDTANQVYDHGRAEADKLVARIREERDNLREQLREAEAKLREKGVA